MDLEIVNKKNIKAEVLDEILSALRAMMTDAILNEDKESLRDEVIQQVNSIRISYNKFKKLSIVNQLFYINYNERFAIYTFSYVSKEDKLDFLKKIMYLNMTKKENLVFIADFITWASGYAYEDKDMCKLAYFFCRNIDMSSSSILFDLYSVINIGDQEKTKKIINDKRKEFQTYKVSRNQKYESQVCNV